MPCPSALITNITLMCLCQQETNIKTKKVGSHKEYTLKVFAHQRQFYICLSLFLGTISKTLLLVASRY